MLLEQQNKTEKCKEKGKLDILERNNNFVYCFELETCTPYSGGSKGGTRDAPLPKISSFSCSFQEKIGQIIGWHPVWG